LVDIHLFVFLVHLNYLSLFTYIFGFNQKWHFYPQWQCKASIELILFVFDGSEDWLTALCLLGRCSRIWVTPSALIMLIIFEIGSYFKSGLAWNTILLFVLPLIADMTGMLYCTEALVKIGSQKLFVQTGLESTISASWLNKIRGLSTVSSLFQFFVVWWLLLKPEVNYQDSHSRFLRENFPQ
jgi:hypothetical protein